MLRWRLMSAAAVLTPVLILVWLDSHYSGTWPGIWLLPLVLVAGLAGSDEVAQMLCRAGTPVSRPTVAMASLTMLLTGCLPIVYPGPSDCPLGAWGWTGVGIVTAMWLIIVREMRAFHEPGQSVSRISGSLFSVVYVVLPICFLIRLRGLYDGAVGVLAVVSVLLVVKLGDTGAYFVGKSIGKRPMSPVLSPKKTWAGTVGALASSTVAAWLFLKLALPALAPDAPDIQLMGALGYGLTLSIAGIVGDLGESLIKRDLRTKDSASWLPGLGGVLDMLDSLLLAAPVGYLWWISGFLTGVIGFRLVGRIP